MRFAHLACFLLSLVFTCSCSHAAAATQAAPRQTVSLRSAPAPSMVGAWRMALHVGDRVFQDELTLKREASGVITGTLTVPGNFTAPVERVVQQGDRLTFEILAPEGEKPYRVKYQAILSTTGRAMAGFATLEDGSLMGTFVARPTGV